jgi:serine protease AprX
MSIEARGAEVMRGPWIRFGIRWDDGNRPTRGAMCSAVAALALLLSAGAAQARPTPVAHTRVLVVAKHDRVAAVQRLTERLGGSVGQRLGIVDGFTARAPAGAIRRLKASASVRAVSRDGALTLRSAEDQPGASSQLVSTAIGAGGSAFDGAGVGVALLDSGVVEVGGLERPGTVVHGPDFSTEGGDRNLADLDAFGHGSHIAGIIAGHDPLTGFEGVAPGARLVSVKVAGADGVTSLERVLFGMEWIRVHRNDRGLNIRVLNLSLGTDESDSYRRDILAWAAERLWRDGVAVVASAGNKGEDADGLDLPAADPFVIAVGASDSQGTPDPADDTVAPFSSHSDVRPPDVVAPGTGIVSLRVPGSTLDTEFPGARIGDGYFRGSGTSQAAAVVSGVAARLLQQRPELTNDQLKAVIVGGAVEIPGRRAATGAGRVDLGRSEAMDTPDALSAKQRWIAASPNVRRLMKDLADHEIGSGEAELWNGRRWSGMKWSGRRWSGMKWAGMKWNGMKWLGDAWDD